MRPDQRCVLLVLTGCLWLSAPTMSQAPSASSGSDFELNEYLQPFAPFLDVVWKARVRTSPDGEPVFDVARWEAALKGQAIRMWHSVGEGSYGGETVVMWDRERKRLVYTYFTTAGFFTTGTIEFVDRGSFVSRETVTGNQSGVTEVESSSELLTDGTLQVKTRMLQRGDWVDRGTVVYRRSPASEPLPKL